jgi:hypothetical protein
VDASGVSRETGLTRVSSGARLRFAFLITQAVGRPVTFRRSTMATFRDQSSVLGQPAEIVDVISQVALERVP